MTADLRLTWLGAAGWLIRWRERVIVLDPFFHRPPQARPTLPITRDELPPIDLLVATHGHYDHFADVPHLAVTRAARTFVPRTAFADLARAWRRMPAPARLHGPRSWTPITDDTRVQVDDLVVSFHRIGTERFDLGMLRTSLTKLAHNGRMADWIGAVRFAASHLFGPCFAVVLEVPTSPRRTVTFFGNLSRNVGQVAARHPSPDLAVLPYCPANGDWLAESVTVARALAPQAVLVHHFDQFMPPVTVGLDMPHYMREVSAQAGVPRVLLPKFFVETTLERLLAAGPPHAASATTTTATA